MDMDRIMTVIINILLCLFDVLQASPSCPSDNSRLPSAQNTSSGLQPATSHRDSDVDTFICNINIIKCM